MTGVSMMGGLDTFAAVGVLKIEEFVCGMKPCSISETFRKSSASFIEKFSLTRRSLLF